MPAVVCQVARISAAVVALEEARGSPQDVEGVISQSTSSEVRVYLLKRCSFTPWKPE